MIVLMPHCGFLSETSRMMLIAQALRACGQDVVVASHGGPFESMLGQVGTDWVLLPPHNDAERQERFLAGLLSWGKQDLPMYADADLAACVDSEVEFMQRTGARAVVTGFTLSAYLSTRLVGLPLVTSHGGSFVRPVLQAGLVPALVNPPQPGMERLPARAGRRVANLAPRLLRSPPKQLNVLADALGVERVPGLMGLMSGDLTLITDLPEVLGLPEERLAGWRPRPWTKVRGATTYRFTGPLYARLDVPVPESLELFLGRHGDRAVLLSPTSVDEGLLRRMVDSVRATGAPVLVTSTVHDVADLADEQTWVGGVLPNHLVMPRVAAAVIMGGQGSVQTAMSAGTPFVGLVHHPEQELNVAVAERRGMAVRLPPSAAGTQVLTGALERILGDPSFATAAKAVQEHYQGVDGASRAAAAVVEFLDGGAWSASTARSRSRATMRR